MPIRDMAEYSSEDVITIEEFLQLWIALLEPIISEDFIVDSGSYVVTGTDANLAHGYILSAEAGSYSLSLTAADVLKKSKFIAESGSYNISLTNANLQYQGQPQILLCSPGSFDIETTDADLIKATILQVQEGSYVITGEFANLVYWNHVILMKPINLELEMSI